jgi:outer membrane immunogenic protein
MSGIAQATDLSLKDTPNYEYTPPSTLWTGPYVGVHVGGGFGNVDVSDTYDYNGDPHADNSYDANGFIAGLQLGYNFRQGNLVYGIEADLGYLNLSGSKYFDLPNPTAGTKHYEPNRDIGSTYSLSGGLYGDLTARVGYAADKTLFYVKGGAAFLNVDTKSSYAGANCTTTESDHCDGTPHLSKFDFSDNETLFGWTIGIGAEYAISPSFSVKLEYQHFDFGSASSNYSGSETFACEYHSYGCTAKLTKGQLDVSPTVDAVTIGLNYQFNRGDDGLR